MDHLDQALEFAGGVGGFFAAVIALLVWLTYLEQTLDRSPRPKPVRTRKRGTVGVVLRASAQARLDSEPRQPTETAYRHSESRHPVSSGQFNPDRDQ